MSVCVCADLALAFFTSEWRGFVGPLRAKAEGVPGILGEGKLPSEVCTSRDAHLVLFNQSLPLLLCPGAVPES